MGMKMYGSRRRDISNCAVRKGDYGRYGASNNHRLGYKATARAFKRRERAEAKSEIHREIQEESL